MFLGQCQVSDLFSCPESWASLGFHSDTWNPDHHWDSALILVAVTLANMALAGVYGGLLAVLGDRGRLSPRSICSFEIVWLHLQSHDFKAASQCNFRYDFEDSCAALCEWGLKGITWKIGSSLWWPLYINTEGFPLLPQLLCFTWTFDISVVLPSYQ